MSKGFTNTLAQIFAQTGLYSGVYSDLDSDVGNMASDQTQAGSGVQWAKLTHSTLVIGYGVEQDRKHGEVKYWIVRNSYGARWGDSSNFRLRRGRNDFGCEAENIAIVPLIYE